MGLKEDFQHIRDTIHVLPRKVKDYHGKAKGIYRKGKDYAKKGKHLYKTGHKLHRHGKRTLKGLKGLPKPIGFITGG